MFHGVYRLIMDSRYPLANLQDVTTRYLLQMLAWMWCIIFNVDGFTLVFGVSAAVHAILIAAYSSQQRPLRLPEQTWIFCTLGRANSGEHE